MSTPLQEQIALARKAATASLIGTAIEWYDFFIFATASTLVFGRVFFPENDPLTGILLSFAIFGVGFFARPLGGIVFGLIGDRKGRKVALVATLMIMGLATTAIALVPTTAQIGILAPILLVILRLVQGFATGGEWGGAALVAVEFAPEGKKGKYGSFTQVGNALGIVMSTGAFAIVSLLPDEQLLSWGWRLPFLFSIVLVVAGLVIRMKLTETPDFIRATEEAERNKAAAIVVTEASPLKTIGRKYLGRTLLAMGIAYGVGTLGYVMLTFVITYSVEFTEIDRTLALTATTVGAAIGVFVFYGMGIASDRFNARRVVMFGATIGMLLAFPFFWLLDTNATFALFAVAIIGFNLAYGPQYAAEPVLFAGLFPARVRYTGLSLVLQIPSILFGMTATIATALLIATNGDPWALSLYILFTQALVFICAYFLRQSTDRDDAELALTEVPAESTAS
ncbi:MFS transporter [Arthrobacter alpinus]|uniref:MFS transporter n=1 Tax=Arthrobacter alpinus TaxID=656366 RepID=UPI0016480C0E|nr:MFS transporter [Arthrobacter alpinus]